MNALTERQIYEEWRELEIKNRMKVREIMMQHHLSGTAIGPPPSVPNYDEWCAAGYPHYARFRSMVAAFFPAPYDEFLSRLPWRIQ